VHDRSRGRAARALGLVFAGAVLVGGCGSGGDPGETAGGGDAGAKVYAAKCAECHGANLEGTAKGPSHLSRVYEPGHHPDAAFRRAIAQGARAHHWNFGDMAPVQGMSEADTTAVIAYIHAQQRERGFTD
jgi:mono/diheme cytochrome c family protein